MNKVQKPMQLNEAYHNQNPFKKHEHYLKFSIVLLKYAFNPESHIGCFDFFTIWVVLIHVTELKNKVTGTLSENQIRSCPLYPLENHKQMHGEITAINLAQINKPF